MSLLGLPTELLSHIVGYTSHATLEHFCLSCKTVFGAGKDALALHRTYKREWQYVRVGAEDEDGDDNEEEHTDSRGHNGANGPKRLFGLLAAIEQDPRVADHIEELHLWCPDLLKPGEEHPRVADLAAVKRLAKQSSLSWPVDWDEFLQGFSEESVPTLTVLLLSLLPNLRLLTLPSEWEFTNHYHRGNTDLLDQIIKDANLTGTGPLSELEALFPYTESMYDSDNEMNELLPFLALKCLKEIYTCNLQAVPNNDLYKVNFTWPHGGASSCLQKIEFAACCIDATGLTELVTHTPQLTSFAYSHASKREGAGLSWSPGEFVAVLGSYCGRTLTNLAITIDDLPEIAETGVSSMNGFTALRQVELDVGVFAGPSIDSGIRQGMGHEEDEPWDPSTTPSLPIVIPAQVEAVRLFVSANEDDTPVRKSCKILRRLLHGLSSSGATFGLAVTSNHAPEDWVAVQEILDGPDVANYLHWVEKETGREPEWKERFIESFGYLFDT